ncbi:hypothetical protein CROQUDRAFT_668184 [Cronartium quercuum f. sp. fusiforme G11]|uniref:Uncharacterized protein n=1 Tax=Cronartium quercuum f. sp. fusiforme G11 TaxID=708437 RepID=A0A9P6TGK6_9BASI|nr:hypothetical protein CROQUDRAFT_668184 [Cronartium quercuum f. sp. fusiforme G11]
MTTSSSRAARRAAERANAAKTKAARGRLPTPPQRVNVAPNVGSSDTRFPKWLESEESQLAKCWMKVSEEPEFVDDQTSQAFYEKLVEDFNKNVSRDQHRDVDQIKSRLTGFNPQALKTAAPYGVWFLPPQGGSVDVWVPEKPGSLKLKAL